MYMDTIIMVTAMVILTESRMSSSIVGSGTIIIPTIAPTQATSRMSLNRVKTLFKFPARISSLILAKRIFIGVITGDLALQKRRRLGRQRLLVDSLPQLMAARLERRFGLFTLHVHDFRDCL